MAFRGDDSEWQARVLDQLEQQTLVLKEIMLYLRNANGESFADDVERLEYEE